MSSRLKRLPVKAINSFLSVLDLQLVRRGRTFQDYIPFQETLSAARAAGLSVGDYIDAKHNVPGATQETIDRMKDLGVFDRKIEHVCEIGPGSGRYLERTIRLCHPATYEIYETAADWRQWLVREYKVTAHPADGRSLSQTPSHSRDLVHAHKVLNGLPILTACRYLAEMVRVVRDGGVIVFDLLTEECMDEITLDRWVASGADYVCSMMPRQYAIDYFHRRGFRFVGSFFITSVPGMTQYFVFDK